MSINPYRHYDFYDERVGHVVIYLRPTSRRITAKWLDHKLTINAPTSIDIDRLRKYYEESIVPFALEHKPKTVNSIDSELLKVDVEQSDTIESHYAQIKYLKSDGKKVHLCLIISSADDINAPDTQTIINDGFKKCMKKVVANTVVAEAWQIARQLGVESRISQIKATLANSRLGSCSSHGVISLSHLLATRTWDERVNTITHEFAHLTHMNHSPEFHDLHQQYLDHILKSKVVVR